MIVKQVGQAHFVKRFDCGARSARVILPWDDGVRIKVTHLFAPVGAEWLDISYPVDETVILVSGRAKIIHDGVETQVSAGACYAVLAGEVYSLMVTEEAEIWCVFSSAPGGSPVDDS